MMHYGFGHFGGGGIYMILFWILLIIGVVYLISRSNISLNSNEQRKNHYRDNHRNYVKDDTKTPEEIARERYAKGEIDKEKLDEILQNVRR